MELLLLISTNLNYTSFISYESTIYLSLYLKAELRYIRFKFSAAILAAILENRKYATVVIYFYIFELYVFLHMDRHFICLYIWKQSRDILDSDFWPSWKFLFFLILGNTRQCSTNRKSLKPNCYFYCILYLIEVILVSRIGRLFGRHIGRHLGKNWTDDIGIYPTWFGHRKNL